MLNKIFDEFLNSLFIGKNDQEGTITIKRITLTKLAKLEFIKRIKDRIDNFFYKGLFDKLLKIMKKEEDPGVTLGAKMIAKCGMLWTGFKLRPTMKSKKNWVKKKLEIIFPGFSSVFSTSQEEDEFLRITVEAIISSLENNRLIDLNDEFKGVIERIILKEIKSISESDFIATIKIISDLVQSQFIEITKSNESFLVNLNKKK